jgi:phage tail protein X
MATLYTTRDGDRLDQVCHLHYGRLQGLPAPQAARTARAQGTVESVLAANPGLAGRGPVLPSGVAIVLPDL